MVDVAVAAAALLVAAASVLVGAALGADAQWALLAAVAFAVNLIRSIRVTTDVPVVDLPAGAAIEDAWRTAFEAAARILPGLVAIFFLGPAVVGWFWPYGLFFGASASAAFAAQYLAAAVGVRRWERGSKAIELQQWRPRARGGGVVYAARAENGKALDADK